MLEGAVQQSTRIQSKMPKRTRDENVAKYGQNNAKEAHGLALVRDAFALDGRLKLLQSAEGARADFCVFFPGAECAAIGCQLKTMHTLARHGQREYYQFGHTGGYSGLMLLLIAFVGGAPRLWLHRGTDVTVKGILIPVVKRRAGYDWDVHEVQLDNLAGALENCFGEDDVTVQPAEEFIKPTSPSRVVEYEAQTRLESQLPLLYKRPDVENGVYDCTVGAAHWQLKVANFDSRYKRFRVTLDKAGGIVDGKPSYRQYAVTDFEWLAVLLPVHPYLSTPGMYLFPMRVLVERGYAGRDDVGGSSLAVAPHSRNAARWAQAFYIDLSTPQVGLRDYARVRYGDSQS